MNKIKSMLLMIWLPYFLYQLFKNEKKGKIENNIFFNELINFDLRDIKLIDWSDQIFQNPNPKSYCELQLCPGPAEPDGC